MRLDVVEGQRRLEKVREGQRTIEEVRESVKKYEKVRGSSGAPRTSSGTSRWMLALATFQSDPRLVNVDVDRFL